MQHSVDRGHAVRQTQTMSSSHSSGRLSAASLVYYNVQIVVALSLLIGGGTRVGLRTDFLLQFMSTPLFGASLYLIHRDKLYRANKLALAFIAYAVLLVIVQLLPLPSAIYNLLPQRVALTSILEVVGAENRELSISFSRHATLYALFSLLPPIAVFMGFLTLSNRRRATVLLVGLGIGMVNVVVAFAQLAGGAGANLSFYTADNIGYAIGLFANRNHFAAMVYALLPIAIFMFADSLRSGKRPARNLSLYYSIGCILLLFAALVATYSRAGLFLGVVSFAASAATAGLVRLGSGRNSRAILIIASAAVLLLLVAGAVLATLIAARSASDTARPLIWLTSLRMATDFYPTGSGFGTFVPLYMTYERLADIQRAYINHAHNDYIELFIEGGVWVLPAWALFFAWLVKRVHAAWQSESGLGGEKWSWLGRASSIAVVLLLTHSLLDYPLRTTALATLFAAMCGSLTPVFKDDRNRRRRA